MRYFAVPSPEDKRVILVSEKQADVASHLARDVAKQQKLSPQLLLVDVNNKLATFRNYNYTFDDGAQNPNKKDTVMNFKTLDYSQREYMATLKVLSSGEALPLSNSLIRKVALAGLAVVATAAGVYAASAYGLLAAAAKFGSLYGTKIAIGGTASATIVGSVTFLIKKYRALEAIVDAEKDTAIELRKDESKTSGSESVDNAAEKVLAVKDKVVTFAANDAKKNASKLTQPAPIDNRPRKSERPAATKRK